jgi:penicillin amidase
MKVSLGEFMNRFAALGVACTLVFSSVSFAGAPERLAGLRESATVSVDAEGIAHVRAGNEHDLYFMQGWLHARERLFQMDYNRRVASGTVAELVGQAGLPSAPTPPPRRVPARRCRLMPRA